MYRCAVCNTAGGDIHTPGVVKRRIVRHAAAGDVEVTAAHRRAVCNTAGGDIQITLQTHCCAIRDATVGNVQLAAGGNICFHRGPPAGHIHCVCDQDHAAADLAIIHRNSHFLLLFYLIFQYLLILHPAYNGIRIFRQRRQKHKRGRVADHRKKAQKNRVLFCIKYPRPDQEPAMKTQKGTR